MSDLLSWHEFKMFIFKQIGKKQIFSIDFSALKNKDQFIE